MTEKFNKSPEEISQYMAERLRRENIGGEAVLEKEKLALGEIQGKALELVELTLEKEDLLKASAADEKILERDGKGKPAQEKVIVGKTNIDSVDFRRLSRGFDADTTIEESFQEGRAQIKEIEQKIAGLAANKEIADAYQTIIKEKIETIKLARQVEGARSYLENLDLADDKLLAQRNSEDVKLTKADKKILAEHDVERQIITEKIDEWMLAPEVYYEVNRRELLDYRRQLLKGGIVETPSVKKEVNQILGHLQLGIPVFLRGHLGAGKTEMLLHIVRRYYGVEPEFISGSEEASKYDIYGKTQLGARSEEDRMKELKIRLDEFKAMNPQASKEEIKEAEKQYYTEIVVKGQTTSFFQYGPLVRAMKEGEPLVIDEIDGIPHSILMRLNHILTRRAGDKIKIQENAGEEIEIEKSFCVLATGNIKSARYKREELDAAFLSRWWSSEIKYLPPDETLKILTASLIDKRGNLELKSGDDFEALKRLTQAAEEIQEIFTGEKTDVFGEGGDAARGISASLEKSVLSVRDLWNIVKPWKARNFDKPLEDYIHAEFIKKATVPKDAIYLTQLFCRFGFFQDWEAEQFGIAGLEKKKLDAFKAAKTPKTPVA